MKPGCCGGSPARAGPRQRGRVAGPAGRTAAAAAAAAGSGPRAGRAPGGARRPGRASASASSASRRAEGPARGRVAAKAASEDAWARSSLRVGAERGVLGAYAGLAAVVALGAVPGMEQVEFPLAFPYFMALAVTSIFLGSVRSKFAPETATISTKQSLAAPLTLSVSLFGLYLLSKFKIDIFTFISAYFFLIETVAGATGLAIPLNALGAKLGEAPVTVPVPPVLGLKDGEGRELAAVDVRPTTALAVALGLGLAAYDTATGHSNFSVNNVEAVLLASLFIENVGLSSYRTALVLLGGLLVYDAFWVFGSKAALTFLLGSNSMLIPEKGSVMLDVAAGSSIVNVPTKLIFPKLAAGSSKLGFSLLGLGDIVVPGLLVAFALNLEAEAGRKETGGGGDAKPTKYFAWTMLAYAVGLGATFCANSVFRSAQPALVYLSPATIGVLYLVAKLRNEEDVLFGYKREGRGAAGGGGR